MKKKPKVLIAGATGLLGPYFVEEFSADDYSVTSLGYSKGHNKIDLTDGKSVSKLLHEVNPDIVINLVAYTDVEGCEKNENLAVALNVMIPKSLSKYMPQNSFLLQISTDQVYGDTKGPHLENSASPVNIYSKTKLDGENEALKHGKTLVLRTNMFGKSKTLGRESISDFFIEHLQKKDKLKLFGDAIFAPLHMQTLAKISNELIKKQTTGIYNAGSNQALSKADFALNIAKHFNLPTSHTEIVASKTFANRTKRPLDVSLNVTKIEKVLGYSMPSLEQEIKKLL